MLNKRFFFFNFLFNSIFAIPVINLFAQIERILKSGTTFSMMTVYKTSLVTLQNDNHCNDSLYNDIQSHNDSLINGFYFNKGEE